MDFGWVTFQGFVQYYEKDKYVFYHHQSPSLSEVTTVSLINHPPAQDGNKRKTCGTRILTKFC